MPTRIVIARQPNPNAARSSAIMNDQEPFVSICAFFVKMVRLPG
jgi:hypothetical protein